MNIEPLLLAGGGLAGALTTYYVAGIRRLEERCEVLDMAQRDVEAAINTMDQVLADEALPRRVRQLATFLLFAYAEEAFGRVLASRVFPHPSAKSAESDTDNSGEAFESDMREFARSNPALERRVRRAFVALTLGLGITYFGDQLELRKVEREVARNPSGLWGRLGFGRHFDDTPNGGMLHAH